MVVFKKYIKETFKKEIDSINKDIEISKNWETEFRLSTLEFPKDKKHLKKCRDECNARIKSQLKSIRHLKDIYYKILRERYE